MVAFNWDDYLQHLALVMENLHSSYILFNRQQFSILFYFTYTLNYSNTELLDLSISSYIITSPILKINNIFTKNSPIKYAKHSKEMSLLGDYNAKID